MSDPETKIPSDVQIELKRLEVEIRSKEIEADLKSARIVAWKAIGVAIVGSALVGVLGAVLNHQYQSNQLAILGCIVATAIVLMQ